MAFDVDVAIIGGGPAGSTVASLLRKYNPGLNVVVLERDVFPRDHVGESQLPSISPILDEMGVWETVEAAGFPVKVGASYTWGASADKWDFDFYPVEEWQDEERPAKFEGQRRYTAFQVDRAIYDKILLDHARGLGATIREETGVTKILVDGDTITSLELTNGSRLTARYYVDATGASGLLRRTLGVESWAPDELRNIAIWDYWQNADWAVEIGTGATRVQVRSLTYGWIWFIPLGPTRTSIGLICPSEYYKQSGKSKEEIYREALRDQPEIAALIEGATPEDTVQATKDWSHLSDRLVGDNWFICGEAAGFADPILAAGMSLAHSSAREVAYSILELDKAALNASWVKSRYEDKTRTNIQQHIRFAQYWYAANGCFTDLQDHCSNIAKEAGLTLNPQSAWQWLSQGGFTTEQLGLATFGSFDIASARRILEQFDPEGRSSTMKISGCNVFKLDLTRAKQEFVGWSHDGGIEQVPCYRKGQRILPRVGYYLSMIQILEQTNDGETILQALQKKIMAEVPAPRRTLTQSACIQALEAMAQQGWVKCSVNKKKPILAINKDKSRHIRSPEDTEEALQKAGRSDILKSPLTDNR